MHTNTDADAWIFIAICVAPAALMLLGQIIIRTWWALLDRWRL